MSFRNAVIEELAKMFNGAKDYDIEHAIIQLATRLGVEEEVRKKVKNK